MENFNISLQLINQVLAYLGTRPYQEVFQLVEAIQAEAKNQQKVENGQSDAS
jgi:hypothetical protein